MNEIESLIEALYQYDKKLASECGEKLNNLDTSFGEIKEEIIHIIKKRRWQISDGKRRDEEFERYIDRYYVEMEVE